MATVTYTFIERCTAGAHVHLTRQLNAGAVRPLVLEIDSLRGPIEETMPIDELLLRLHFAGRTRAQIATEFQAGPVVITI